LAYIECTDQAVNDAYYAKVGPILILRHRGQELARFATTPDGEQVRQAIAACFP
jgi:hypothetical protein